MENKWIVISIDRVEPIDEYISRTYFTARNKISGQEKEFYSVVGPQVGDEIYPTNEE